MKKIIIVAISIILPVTLFPGKDSDYFNIYSNKKESYFTQQGLSIPLGYTIESEGFYRLILEDLSKRALYGANLGIKKAGDYSLNIPLSIEHEPAFYRVKFVCANQIVNETIIYLPALATNPN